MNIKEKIKEIEHHLATAVTTTPYVDKLKEYLRLLLTHITDLEAENTRLRGDENKVTLKEAAVLNCLYCSGYDSRYHPKPYFQRGQETYQHGGETGASGSVPCTSGQIYAYIDSLSKDNHET